MKIQKRVVEARLRDEVIICEQQYGFMSRKSSTDAMFALRMLIEKYREHRKRFHLSLSRERLGQGATGRSVVLHGTLEWLRSERRRCRGEGEMEEDGVLWRLQHIST